MQIILFSSFVSFLNCIAIFLSFLFGKIPSFWSSNDPINFKRCILVTYEKLWNWFLSLRYPSSWTHGLMKIIAWACCVNLIIHLAYGGLKEVCSLTNWSSCRTMEMMKWKSCSRPYKYDRCLNDFNSFKWTKISSQLINSSCLESNPQFWIFAARNSVCLNIYTSNSKV